MKQIQNIKPISIFNGEAFIANPEKVLGEKITVSTRFGGQAINYKGGIELLDKIEVSQAIAEKVLTGNKANGEMVLSSNKILISEVAPAQNMITDEAKSNIEKAIEISEANIATKTVNKIKSKSDTSYDLPTDNAEILSFEEVYNYVNKKGGKNNNISKDDLQAFVYYQMKIGRRLSEKWTYLSEFSLGMVNNEPTINKLINNSALFYQEGNLYPKYIYLSGDISAKKQLLEQHDRDYIINTYGQQVYDKQHALLMTGFDNMVANRLTIIPKAYDESGNPVNKLIIKPISTFARNFKINTLVDEKPFKVVMSKAQKTYGEPDFDAKKNEGYSDYNKTTFETLTLPNAFIYWLKFYTSEYKFKKSGMNWKSIRDFYIDRVQYYEKRDGSKADYKRKCSNCQAEGERLFDIFLQKWLTPFSRELIENQWNDQFFGFKQMDYDLVPIAFECAKYELDGSPMEFRFEKRDAVAFTFSEGSGLLAYQVGVGKTRSAIFTIAQFMSAGFCKRPFLVVPNQTYKQWISEITHLLPQYQINDLYNLSKDYINELKGVGAWVLRSSGQPIDEKQLWTDDQGRQMYGPNKLESQFLTDVAIFNDIMPVKEYTITMLTYEGFKRIGFNDWTAFQIKSDLNTILEQGEYAKADGTITKSTEKQEEAKRLSIASDVGKALAGRIVNIEDLGFDFMVIDEAHSCKKVFTRVKGEVVKDSVTDDKRQKSAYAIESGNRSALALKAFCISHYIQMQNKGNNVLLLTATPFTNSPLEVYSMLALISYHKLKDSSLSSLHTFFDEFVQVENELVINSKLQPERKDVFKGFNKLQALQALIARFMIYKEGGSPDEKGRLIELTRPNKYVLPLKYDPKSEVKALLPVEDQIKTNISLNPLQENLMVLIKAYVEGKLSIDSLESNVYEICDKLGILSRQVQTKEKTKTAITDETPEVVAYTENELKGKTIEQLLTIAKDEYNCYTENLKGINKTDLIEYLMEYEPSGSIDVDEPELIDREAVVVDESELDDKEKRGVRVLRGVNYARSLALSPYLFFETVFERNDSKYAGIKVKPDYKSYIETSPKIKYTMECIRSVKKYHEAKGEPISGQIIYADRGKDNFDLLSEYLVKEIGYKKHEVVIIKSGSDKEAMKNLFLGQYYDAVKGRYEDIPDEKRAKIVIGSSSIKEGINLQRYTSVLYNLFLPWNPTDVIQLEGRAWRQGNVFRDIRIDVPLMDNSMDIFMFQKLEEKASRINQIWNRDGKTSIIRLEEFNPIELKKELISDPEVLAQLEIETEEEKLEDELQDIENTIAIANRINDLIYKLTPQNYYYGVIKDIVKKYRGDKEYSHDALFNNYKNIISTQKDQNDQKITRYSFDYSTQIGPEGIKEISEFKNLQAYLRALKTLEKDFLVPNQLPADSKAIELFIKSKNEQIKQLKSYLSSIKSEENIAQIVENIKEEREKENYTTATAMDRVYEFEKLNYLLSNRTFKNIETFTKEDLDMDMPPMKDGVRLIDKVSIDKLENYLKTLPQTKALHTTPGTDMYDLDRIKLHDKIIDEMREGAVCIKRDNPIAILTGGLPGSGKSTFLKQYSEYLTSDKIFAIDADAVRAKLPEYKGWNAEQTHKETSDIVSKLLDGCKDGIPCHFDILYDGTMNKAKNYIPLIKKLHSLGYKTFIIFIEIPPEVTRERVLQRYKKSGRYVPRAVIEEGIKNGLTAFDELKQLVNGYMLVDGETREIIERKGEQIPIDREYFQSKNKSESVMKFEPEAEEKPKAKTTLKVVKHAKKAETNTISDFEAEIEGLKILIDIADTEEEKANLQAEIEGLTILMEIA